MERKISFLPERFREAMVAANMTQLELSVKVGVSVSSIRRYMAGAPIAQSNVRADISRVLNVNIAWLTGRTDAPERTPAQKHLDKVRSVMSALRKDEQLFDALNTLADASEDDSLEVSRALGVPTDLKPIEVRKEVAKAGKH